MIVEKMAQEIGVPVEFIVNLANSASYEYKKYEIPKRTGGSRTIYHPSRRLKALQRWLLINVINGFPVHRAAQAYVAGGTILRNAKMHVHSRYLLRLDLIDFFPSISRQDIANYMAAHPDFFTGWSTIDSFSFCSLVSRNRALTIGAPTSPGLSNAICFELDAELDNLSSKNHLTYTRYADDLFFSANSPNILRDIENQAAEIVGKLLIPSNLRINRAKTRHSSKRSTRRVTGIVLGSDGQPYIGRGLKRRIRALVHQYDSLDNNKRASLAGLIAYAVGFDPDFLNSLIQKYGPAIVRKARSIPK